MTLFNQEHFIREYGSIDNKATYIYSRSLNPATIIPAIPHNLIHAGIENRIGQRSYELSVQRVNGKFDMLWRWIRADPERYGGFGIERIRGITEKPYRLRSTCFNISLRFIGQRKRFHYGSSTYIIGGQFDTVFYFRCWLR